MKIFGELLTLIDTFNIYIYHEDSNEIKDIFIKDNAIYLKGCSDLFEVKFSGNIKLKPNSVSCIHYEPSWLCFKIQLELKTRIINNVLEELVREMSSFKFEDNSMKELVNNKLQIRCKCNYPLSEYLEFVKLRPLPSFDWELASENWFCHVNEKHKKSMKNSDLSPNQNECFFNELIFTFHPSILLINSTSNSLHCRSCSREVGYLKGIAHNLWTHEFLCMSDDKVLFSKNTSDIIFTLFDNLGKENIGSSLRLVFEFKSKTPEFIYILVMDNHLSLYTTEDSPLYSLQPKSSENPPKKQKLKESNSYVLNKMNSIKVLYKVKGKADEESGLWLDDINVNIVSCGRLFFDAVIELLDCSNCCVPHSLRIVDDLKVGYFVKV